MEYIDMYKKWLEFDEDTRKELEGLDEKEIMERFYKELEFGTGGLRGIIGAGTNRMNVYTVRKATQGLANYIKKQGIENPSVTIAYDSRLYSDRFAKEAALVLNANGIKTYMYKELRPTPMLSFAVRHLKSTAGIVITASHNPKQYNGYKVYWSDGGQVTEEHAEGILKEITSIDYSDIKTMEFDKAVNLGLFNYIDDEVEKDYVELVKGLTVNWDVVDRVKDTLKVIYTPLHGTGNKPVRRVLGEIGYKNVYVVKEQENPDPNFSTVKYPNPEEHEVFTRAIEMAKELEADLIIGTDPDCDRVGVVVKNKEGEYVVLTGNQTGALLTHYILENLKATGKMPENGVVIKTIVTTEMARKIAESYNVEIMDVLTGFKYIGEKIKEFEEKKDRKFIFGFEESYGYLAGDFVRDKDGVIASMLICEMAGFYKLKGMSLYEGLMSLYEKYGYFVEDLKSVTLEGIEGSQRIKEIMEMLRKDPPRDIAGIKVKEVKDYLKGIGDLPKSNVVQIILEDESIITARPSGTEPKIKFYFAVKGKDNAEAKDKVKRIKDEFLKHVKL
ncbi:phospho-sugar mutase [Caloramator sp. Dgby_cultured_2]|uniref:phospho-sugar mutase n=1 Tax=Caloramator sp. Dgby_cultured_2 TaxID=3029174 RepID=UPI00237DC747|nr:phospho-sugar mutase [Caloramator sp. Dgby_cultured_2]WDU82048.1 phospho-sugar mutase [Caloramator sp. Dgby_cultured_2]